ncbi:periplasmic/secreted protein [Paucimonas lemoignei]|nr:periplasmic/secreted protein [Paucimonas lemoignei]
MFSLRPATALLALGAAALISAPAMAEEVHYNQVSVHAEVNKEVSRDLMNVTLYTEAQNTDPAKLAAEVTETLNKALGQARQVKDITIRQGNRSSYPIYEEKGQKITGWRERAELRLESADFAALSKLTGEMLGDMKMGGMDFAIATPTRKASEDELLKEAVKAFRTRAQLVTDALGGTGYKLVNLNFNTSGYPQPYLRAPVMMMKAARGADAAPTPDVEAGTSQVTVTADGTIEVAIP